ncbi:hypothetical protein B0I35DRAFT_170004 [Stachybotrys elegans]|uniref:Xylanolytic transcriptional activator regulatory domain-containing protein n=1 Tax=Stachybotrys elegans TaxID=80388 RepID=A0A8K0WU05_9HYPO|nr:hypothetical protein B0I35DRAFT_170004 [Stachybotrys elegans]
MQAEDTISASDASSPALHERGSLRTFGKGRSQFIGSSSGIFFVNRVRQAFATVDLNLSSEAQDGTNPSPEDCLVADEEDGQDGPVESGLPTTTGPSASLPSLPAGLGRFPPRDVASHLFMSYFRTWHLLFPFVHGPTAAKDVESLYASEAADASQQAPSLLPTARMVTLQCIFNLASIHSDVELPSASRIDTPNRVLPSLLGLVAKGDTDSIQAIFSVQLLLVARMSLRTASVVAGLLSRAIFLAGLHRCPVRYGHFSDDECLIRKRLFWSIYVFDRFLSQALGQPLGIQDSDVDVCSLLGPERHRPFQHYIEKSSASISAESTGKPGLSDTYTSYDVRQNVLAYQVNYHRLMGRALELFHKSIHIRSIDPDTVLRLGTDLDMWWNSLPAQLMSDDHDPPGDKGSTFSYPGFFALLYNQLRLLINRPWLSLEPTTAEFGSRLQTCVGLSRNIILDLTKQQKLGYALFWPGQLSAIWMAGIILAFACHLQRYPREKGNSEITLCLSLLKVMSKQWPSAKHCHTVLSDLQQALQKPVVPGAFLRSPYELPTSKSSSAHAAPHKRRRTVRDSGHTDERHSYDGLHYGRPTNPLILAESPAPTSVGSSTQEAPQRQDDAATAYRTTEDIPDTGNPGWVPEIGHWDGGLPDVLGGVTWESLLQTLDHENFYAEGSFF